MDTGPAPSIPGTIAHDLGCTPELTPAPDGLIPGRVAHWCRSDATSQEGLRCEAALITAAFTAEEVNLTVFPPEGGVIVRPKAKKAVPRHAGTWHLAMDCPLAGATPGVTFGQALEALKLGQRVARSGWNGRGMFLFLIPGSTFEVQEGRPMAAHYRPGTVVQYHAHIDMQTAQGYVIPWLASQADLLEEDWGVLEWRELPGPR